MTYNQFAQLSGAAMRAEIVKMKYTPLDPAEMYRAVGLDQARAYRVLREKMGGKSMYCKFYADWKRANKLRDNPTCGFCARMTALYVQKLARSQPFKLLRVDENDPPNKPIDHYFLVLEVNGEAQIVDLTCDQIGNEKERTAFPYEKADFVRGPSLTHLQKGRGATLFANDFMQFYEALG